MMNNKVKKEQIEKAIEQAIIIADALIKEYKDISIQKAIEICKDKYSDFDNRYMEDGFWVLEKNGKVLEYWDGDGWAYKAI